MTLGFVIVFSAPPQAPQINVVAISTDSITVKLKKHDLDSAPLDVSSFEATPTIQASKIQFRAIRFTTNPNQENGKLQTLRLKSKNSQSKTCPADQAIKSTQLPTIQSELEKNQSR
jgi:hypothetical protein